MNMTVAPKAVTPHVKIVPIKAWITGCKLCMRFIIIKVNGSIGFAEQADRLAIKKRTIR